MPADTPSAMTVRDVDPETARVAETRLQAARAKAVSSVTPYFGTALSSMVMHAVPGLGTVATDTRWRFYYDPQVVAGWTLGMCIAAWLHELKHNLHRHAERFEALGEPAARHSLFNLAGDAFINEDLRELAVIAGRGADPTPVELGDDWVYFGTLPVEADGTMVTEQVYRLLVDKAVDACAHHGARRGAGTEACTCGQLPGLPHLHGHDCGSAAGSRHVGRWWELPQDSCSDGSVDEGRGDLIAFDTARQVAAHERAHGRGSVPGGMARWAADLLDPVVDWRAELRSVVSNRCAAVAGRRDYSYRRPGRRHAPHGVILPSMIAPAPPSGAIVLDTSGSMGDTDLAQGVAEVAGILKNVSRGRSRLSVIACDAAAASAQAVRKATDIALVGGGGTDMRIGMDAAAALRPRMDFIVVFTDGDTPWPQDPPAQNPGARYIAVLCSGDRPGVPQWMHTIVVGRG